MIVIFNAVRLYGQYYKTINYGRKRHAANCVPYDCKTFYGTGYRFGAHQILVISLQLTHPFNILSNILLLVDKQHGCSCTSPGKGGRVHV